VIIPKGKQRFSTFTGTMQAGPQTAGAGAPDRCRSVVGTTGPGAVAGSTAAGTGRCPGSGRGSGVALRRPRCCFPAARRGAYPPPPQSGPRMSYLAGMRWRPWPTRWGPASACAPSPVPIASLASAWRPSAASRGIAWARRDPEDREDERDEWPPQQGAQRGRTGPVHDGRR
jgi:hypothetical protein